MLCEISIVAMTGSVVGINQRASKMFYELLKNKCMQYEAFQ